MNKIIFAATNLIAVLGFGSVPAQMRTGVDIQAAKPMTGAQWAAAEAADPNAPALGIGRIGLNTDNCTWKIGDGVHDWDALPVQGTPFPNCTVPPVVEAAPQLISYFPFDTDFLDVESNNTLAVNGTPTIEQTGLFGGSVRLEGGDVDNDYFVLDPSSGDHTTSQCWSFWANTLDENSSGIYVRAMLTADPFYAWSLDGNSGGLIRYAANTATPSIESIDSDAPYQAGRWTHYVFGHDPEGVLSLYIDGVLQSGSVQVEQFVLGEFNGFRIGARRSTNGQGLNGYLDELRIYHDCKLDQAFVDTLFSQSQSPVTPAPEGELRGGVATIFGVESTLDKDAALWANKPLKLAQLTATWEALQPTAPACRPNCTSEQLRDPANFDFSTLEADMAALGPLGMKAFGFMLLHGNDAPGWLYDNQIIAGSEGRSCPAYGSVRITYVDNAAGATAKLTQAGGLNANMVSGRSYRVTGDVKVTGGTATFVVDRGDAGDQLYTNVGATWVAFDETFTFNGGTPELRFTGLGAGEVAEVRRISVTQTSPVGIGNLVDTANSKFGWNKAGNNTVAHISGPIYNWGDYNPANFGRPTYYGALIPPAYRFNGSALSGDWDDFIPVVGCTVTNEGYLQGAIPDHWDSDYHRYYWAMQNAVTTKILEEMAPTGRLDGMEWLYTQPTTGRSGDARIVSQDNLSADYFSFDGMAVSGTTANPRNYYPANYLQSQADLTDPLFIHYWAMWITLLKLDTANPDAGHLLINMHNTNKLPDLFTARPGFTEERRMSKSADFTQGETLSLMRTKAAGVLAESGNPSTTRGEFGESYKNLDGPYPAGMDPTSSDGFYANDRVEQEFYWQLLQALHTGLDWPNYHYILRDWEPLYGTGADPDYDELPIIMDFFNSHVGFKSPTLDANEGLGQAAHEQSLAAESPYAFIAFRFAPDWEKNYPAPVGDYTGQPMRVVVDGVSQPHPRWTAFETLYGPRGLKVDKENRSLTYFSPAAYARETASLTHMGHRVYGGNYTMFITENNPEQSVGWWDQGPINSRYGKFAKAPGASNNINLNVEDDFIGAGDSYTLKLIYLNKTGDNWSISHINEGGTSTWLGNHTGDNASGVWAEREFTVSGFETGRLGDITITRTAGTPRFHMVHLTRNP